MRPPTTNHYSAADWMSRICLIFFVVCVFAKATMLRRKTLIFCRLFESSLCFVDVRKFSPNFYDKPIVHNHTAADWQYHFAVIVCTDAFRTTSEWNANGLYLFFVHCSQRMEDGRVCVCARAEEESFQSVKTIEGIDRVLYCQYTCPFLYGFNFRMACNGSTRQFLANSVFSIAIANRIAMCPWECYSMRFKLLAIFFFLTLNGYEYRIYGTIEEMKKKMCQTSNTHICVSHLKRRGRTRNPTDNNGTD